MKTTKNFTHSSKQAVQPRNTYERIMAAVSQFKGKIERRQPKDRKTG